MVPKGLQGVDDQTVFFWMEESDLQDSSICFRDLTTKQLIEK